MDMQSFMLIVNRWLLFSGLDYWTGILDWTTGLEYWTGLLDWNTGLDYWTDIFLVFTHVVVSLIDSHW